MRLLLVEDNPADADLVREACEELPVTLEVLSDGDAALAYLRQAPPFTTAPRPDLVLLDLKIPGTRGLEVLAKLAERGNSVPIVVLTSSSAPADLAAAYRLGARACFAKPATRLDALIVTILQFFERAMPPPSEPPPPDQESTSRPRAIEADLVQHAAEAIGAIDLDGRIIVWNAAAEDLYGYLRREVVGQSVEVIIPPERRDEWRRIFDGVRNGAPLRQMRTERVDRRGTKLHVELTLSPIRDATGEITGVSVIARDATEQTAAEDRFRLAVEASSSAMVMVDAQGTVVMANQAAARLFGLEHEGMTGASIEEFVPELARERRPHHRAQFLRSPTMRAMSGRAVRGRRRDGREVSIEVGLNPIETRDGTFVLCSIVDLTERERAEERFRLAVEASPSGIVMVDEDGTILLANAELERMFGYERGELIGQRVERLIPGRFRERHAGYRASFVVTPESRSMGSGRDLFGLRKDGTEFPVEVGLNPIRTPDGTLVLSTIVDITARKEAESALEQQRAELARSNEELEQFAYVASHDLQEPLRMVASYTSLLSERYRDVLDARGEKYIRYIQEGASRMRQLIDDILQYSRVRRGATLRRVEAGACLMAARANLALTIRDRRAQMDFAVGEEVVVQGDETQLTLLFQNLLSNALKFTPGEAPRVRVFVEEDGAFYRFAVEDEGVGVPPEHAARIFEMFERLHGRDRYAGTGIGLAICRRIVEHHGGTIWVESDGVRGSTFFFTLPRP